MQNIETLTTQVLSWCDRLANLSEEQGALTRTFLSAPMRDVHAQLSEWMQRLGMHVHVDAAGNLRGRYEGATPDAPTLYVGSHLDTVPNAGRYDGALGVVLAIAMVEALAGERLRFAIEVVGFSEEEGVRFGTPFIGSRALIGTLDDALLDKRDASGVSVREALRAYGLNVDALSECVAPDGSLGFLEVHIEQGPVLEAQDQPLAVVDAIVGLSRLEVTFTGSANHAGTTPMELRRDALAGAAQFILAVEGEARVVPGLVGTVGRVTVKPGAANVVPGDAVVTVDVRHARDETRADAVNTLLRDAESIAVSRGLRSDSRSLLDQAAVPMDEHFTRLLRTAAGADTPILTSGAGHDAMILAARMPSAMLFVRSPGGVSHHPDEAVLEGDVRAALETSVAFLRLLHENPAKPRGRR